MYSANASDTNTLEVTVAVVQAEVISWYNYICMYMYFTITIIIIIILLLY